MSRSNNPWGGKLKMTEDTQKKRDPIWVYVAVALLLLAGFVWYSVDRKPQARPPGTHEDLATLAEREDLNILFLLVDTLRANHMGSYGYERPTTPALDELASNGIRFAHQISQSSWTKSSMAAIWTSLYLPRNGIHDHSHGIVSEARMPAEVLAEHGFETAGIWRNGWVAPNFGFEQGFKTYIRPPVTGRDPEEQAALRELPSSRVLEGNDDDLMFSAIEFIRTHRTQRWFLYLHFMDLHQYISDEDSVLFGTTYMDMYDNAIRREDRLIGELLEVLRSFGLSDRTVVVLASDHGEGFHEHGTEGHARNLYGEVTHVPFIIGLPIDLEEGIVVEERTANVDIWPTLFELLGLESVAGVDGVSQMDAIRRAALGAAPESSSRRIFSQLDRSWGQVGLEPNPLVAVTEGDLRFVHDVKQPEDNELYDLGNDPGEQKNLVSMDAEKAKRWQEITRSHREDSELMWDVEVPVIELDDMELNHLRALGYDIR